MPLPLADFRQYIIDYSITGATLFTTTRQNIGGYETEVTGSTSIKNMTYVPLRRGGVDETFGGRFDREYYECYMSSDVGISTNDIIDVTGARHRIIRIEDYSQYAKVNGFILEKEVLSEE